MMDGESAAYRMLAAVPAVGAEEHREVLVIIRGRRDEQGPLRVLMSMQFTREVDGRLEGETVMIGGSTLRGVVDGGWEYGRDRVGRDYRLLVEALMAAERQAADAWVARYGACDPHTPIRWWMGCRITPDAWEALSHAQVDVFWAALPGGGVDRQSVDIAQVGAFPATVTMDVAGDAIGFRLTGEPEYPGARYMDGSR